MNEDEVVRVMLNAKTEEECVKAKELSLSFLKDNPGNLKVAMAGESLHMTYNTALQRIKSGTAQRVPLINYGQT